MGRHSAPDDDDDVDPAAPAIATSDSTTATPGRHASLDLQPRDSVLTSSTGKIRAVVDPELDRPLPEADTQRFTPLRDDAQVATVAVADELTRTEAPDADDTSTGTSENKAAARARRKAAKQAAREAARAEKAELKRFREERRAEELRAASSPADGSDLVDAPADETVAPADDTDVDRDDVVPAKPSDLALLRTDSAARARVFAAIVVPFALYLGVLAVIDEFELRTVLIWIWVPMITAGVVAGLMLDLGHRAAAARAIESLEAAPDAEPETESTPPRV